MRVLLDNCVDVRFARLILTHEVGHARDHGWQELENGKLLTAAEDAGFDVLVTTDKNMRYQQNLSGRRISLITLSSRLAEYDYLVPLADQLGIVLNNELAAGSVIVLEEG
jgi:predicted nuclease of predicted toxin-antitoxin system